MMKKEVRSHLAATSIYFLVVSLFNFRIGLNLVLLWLGAFLGTFLLDLDHLVLCLDPENKTWWAEKFRHLWRGKRYKEAVFYLVETHLEHRTLTFHSVLFQPILLVLAFFVLTSTGSLFGLGLVMSMNLHLLKDEWQCFFEEGRIDWLFWQIKREIDKKGQKIYLLTVTCFFGLLTLLLL